MENLVAGTQQANIPMINLLFFGRLCNFCSGVPKQIEAANVTQILEILKTNHPLLVRELESPQVMVAVNKKLTDWHSVIKPGDEVAFLPPVTGG